MKPIGGYFELELSKGGMHYHGTPYVLKSGRAALREIFRYIKPSLVYLPYYTCDALLEPFEAEGVEFRFYEINEFLEPVCSFDLLPGEYLLYINYFDLKRDAVQQLSSLYKDKLIVDCTQSFFMQGNGVSWFFNSCRKFFGVPDGAYLYVPDGVSLPTKYAANEDYSVEHLVKRFNGHPGEGYRFFQDNEKLAGGEVFAISKLSEYLLSQINYDQVATQRRENYKFLQARLQHINLLPAQPVTENVPMCYPLLLNEKVDKASFFDRQIFVPSFWKDTLERADKGFNHEKWLTEHLLPLPVDQRYSRDDMELIISVVSEVVNKNV